MSAQCEIVLRELKRAGLAGLTRMELQQRVFPDVLGVTQRISELKRAGVSVACVRERTTAAGRGVWRYRVVEA